MTSKSPPTVNPSSFLLPATTIAIAIAIFVVDTIASLEIAVSPFYAAVVLLAVRFLDGRNVLLVAIGCVVLSLLSFWLTQEDEPSAIALANLVVGILVIALTLTSRCRINRRRLRCVKRRVFLTSRTTQCSSAI